MEINFSIRVVNDDGDPVPDVSVTVYENVLLSNYAREEEITDDDGWVYFCWDTMLDDFYYVTVEIEDDEVGRYTFKDGDSTSYVYPT